MKESKYNSDSFDTKSSQDSDSTYEVKSVLYESFVTNDDDFNIID